MRRLNLVRIVPGPEQPATGSNEIPAELLAVPCARRMTAGSLFVNLR
jgi:hypothetical protein